MTIKILHLIEGARQATGLTVVIDVFRAFSLACYLADQGADTIIPVGDIQEAYRLKKENPGFILVGERDERKPEGFDYGNSPTHVQGIDFTGKTIVHTTSAGTQGIANATRASEIITGSFVNADAITRYVRQQGPGEISLVCMGYSAREIADEDLFCALYIEGLLKNEPVDFYSMVKKLKTGSGKRLFEEKNQGHSPASDFYLCTALDRFDFVLKVVDGKLLKTMVHDTTRG